MIDNVAWFVVQYKGGGEFENWYDLREDVEDQAEADRIIQDNIDQWNVAPKMGDPWDDSPAYVLPDYHPADNRISSR